MSKYENAIKLMEERCGMEKKKLLLLRQYHYPRTLTVIPARCPYGCAYYEDGVFYVSTDAKKNKNAAN